MQVVLLKDIKGFGFKGDVKNVKDGYFQNFLFPKKLAVKATAGKIKEAELKRKNEIVQKDRLLAEANEIVKKLDGVKFVIKSKANEEKLYGSISESDIVKIVEEQASVKLESSYIKLSDHIKLVGSYEIPVHIVDGADAIIHLEVKGE